LCGSGCTGSFLWCTTHINLYKFGVFGAFVNHTIKPLTLIQ